MQQLSVGDILNKQIEQSSFDHLIYMVHLEALVFYIGQSKRDVVTRFWEHINKPSRLGQLIALNEPDSLKWQVRFFNLADCRPFVQQKRLFQDQAWEHFDMTMAEKALITHFRPVVNADFNPKPTPLPSHFKGRHLFTAVSTPLFNNGSKSAQEIAWQNKMRLNGWVSMVDENGRFYWKHQSGQTLSDKQIALYRANHKVPPA